MRDFRSNNRFGGRGGGRSTMHPATCDKCGRDCEVPFQPTGEKPVYCNECFSATGGRDGQSRSAGGYRNSRFGSQDSGRAPMRRESAGKDYSQEFTSIHTKLDMIMEALQITKKSNDFTDNAEVEEKSDDNSLMLEDLMKSDE
jgi:CxxC-x17-CxxC domain-containing protein